jgi:hypothetical protein
MPRRLSGNRRTTAEKRVLDMFSLDFRRVMAPTFGQ